MNSIREKYLPLISKMMSGIGEQVPVSDSNVFQLGNPALLPAIDTVLTDYLLPGSRVDGFENLDSLYRTSMEGEPCLLLLEHYSNFDLPAFHYLLRQKGPEGRAIADALVSIAGIKLNESNPMVSAFAQAYTRIVIYPSRSLEIIKKNFKEPNRLYHEITRSHSINRAAMKCLNSVKTTGKLVLVFPAGTRYRPWDPSSKQGVREIASYIKTFSKFCLVAINGNILRINPSGEMEEDLLNEDNVVFTVGPMKDCYEYRARIKEEYRSGDDRKQALVDRLMMELEEMHERVEEGRQCRDY
ncbi:MAG: 1-acyl-sn-glycerol-3-phosphate acyltransferase [Spirochaetaceae bacterium]|nr:1-acyl-sn-glycerol-3-phosphate acyltransferase [Spirochaetaceae bacterium]